MCWDLYFVCVYRTGYTYNIKWNMRMRKDGRETYQWRDDWSGQSEKHLPVTVILSDV